ncbi:Lipase member H [Eumeta japonica]|uniref:Lipase member H n=1 Tax=Eumeta variegata TaxID=151549 RepID=A0A4C1YRK9_EUMVA|nr:Lipase member H [Eumeta japonica]
MTFGSILLKFEVLRHQVTTGADMLTRVLLLIYLIRAAISGNPYELVLKKVKCDCNRSTDVNVSEVKFYFYNFMTNENASCFLDEADEVILQNPNFNSEQCMHIFIPGFQNNINSTAPNEVRCALANYTCNSKKIMLGIIDHSAYLSGNLVEDLDYVDLYKKAVSYTASISVAIGKFVVSLLKVLGKDKVMVSGHSLGAQMAGLTGAHTINLGYPMRKIYAIDPAGPCFADCPSQHVKSGQADNVMAIHCNAGELGSNLNLTDCDAYSGNGVTQIGCAGANNVDLIGNGLASTCSHSKCVPIAMQTALDSSIWQAKECDSYTAYSNGACDSNSKMLVNYDLVSNNTQAVYFFQPYDNLTCTS